MSDLLTVTDELVYAISTCIAPKRVNISNNADGRTGHEHGLLDGPARAEHRMGDAQFSGRVAACYVVAAPPEIVYRIIADYHDGHPNIAPRRYFPRLEVEAGGVGAGTRVRFDMKLLGLTRTFRSVIDEPEPGRVLVEADVDGTSRTTFTVDPLAGGASSRVTIETRFVPRFRALAFIENAIVSLMLRRVYREELLLLAERARSEVAGVSVRRAERGGRH